MNKNIILGGMSVALFIAGLFFLANSGTSNAVATEVEINPTIQRPAACQRLVENGTCGGVANGGTCGCGKNGSASCQASGQVDSNDGAKAESKTACGCQKSAQ